MLCRAAACCEPAQVGAARVRASLLLRSACAAALSRLCPAPAPHLAQEGDSTSKKLSGALLNALIFIGVVAVMTFVLVLLFKYGCVKLIYAYMGFAGFSIFFVLAGVIALELLQKWDVHTGAWRGWVHGCADRRW